MSNGSVITVDSDSDAEAGPSQKKQKMNALDARVLRVDKIANELKRINFGQKR